MVWYIPNIYTTFIGEIWSKNSRVSVLAGIWYHEKFEYAEFNSDDHFFPFSTANTLLWQIWSKKSKLSIYAKI